MCLFYVIAYMDIGDMRSACKIDVLVRKTWSIYTTILCLICCPAPGRPESAARGTSSPDNKSRGCCCRNSRPTVINPDYNMTKRCCMKRIYDKIHPKSPPNLATSPTCLHCDVTHLSLTTGVVALHIPTWRIEVREERRQARKIVWPVNAGRVICRYQNNLCGIINHHKHIRYCFLDV